MKKTREDMNQSHSPRAVLAVTGADAVQVKVHHAQPRGERAAVTLLMSKSSAILRALSARRT